MCVWVYLVECLHGWTETAIHTTPRVYPVPQAQGKVRGVRGQAWQVLPVARAEGDQGLVVPRWRARSSLHAGSVSLPLDQGQPRGLQAVEEIPRKCSPEGEAQGRVGTLRVLLARSLNRTCEPDAELPNRMTSLRKCLLAVVAWLRQPSPPSATSAWCLVWYPLVPRSISSARS